MAHGRFFGGVMLLLLISGVHVVLGCYASFTGGAFRFGATMPERYFIHSLTGDETTFNPTGAAVYHLNDLCLQSCEGCNLACYPYSRVLVNCDYCEIATAKGAVLARDGYFFYTVVSNLELIENVSFRCYRDNETACGFEEKIFGNYTLLHEITPY
jgi:hypothetical protein